MWEGVTRDCMENESKSTIIPQFDKILRQICDNGMTTISWWALSSVPLRMFVFKKIRGIAQAGC